MSRGLELFYYLSRLTVNLKMFFMNMVLREVCVSDLKGQIFWS